MTNTSRNTNQSKNEATVQLIEVRHLEKSPLNVRHTVAKGADAELKASILAHGLMQNLVVTPAGKGKYHVIAGGRRLEAIHALQKEKSLPTDYLVPCQVVNKEHAEEMSLAENTVRQAMHPADEFEAYAKLANKLTAEEISQRFGTTKKHVLQRLKLGRVAPDLLKLYRAGDISLEALMAFTITDDQKRQMKVYRSLQGWQKDNATHIRGLLTEQMIGGDSKLAKFVGLKAYAKAGGRSRADLFEDDTYLENPEIVHRLAAEKLNAAAEQVRAEGWAWVEVSEERDYNAISECSRIKPKPLNAPKKLVDKRENNQAELIAIEQEIEAADPDNEEILDQLWEKEAKITARLREIDEQLEEYLAFDPEQKKVAGCYVTIGGDGKLDISYGLVKKQDQKTLLADGRSDDGDEDAVDSGKSNIPESLRRDLQLYRLQAAQIEIAKHPEIAFDLAVFTMAHRVLERMPVYSGAQISISQTFAPPFIKDTSQLAQNELKKIEESLPRAWLEQKDNAAKFAAFRQLSQQQKFKLLAYSTALSLQPQLNPEPDKADFFEDALALTGGNVARYWRPTTESYLKRIKTDQILELGRTIFGDDWVQKASKLKKGQIVSQLDSSFANPEKPEHSHEEAEKLRNWLPEGMAFNAVPSPRTWQEKLTESAKSSTKRAVGI